ncbi:MAG: AAC(3) family N-acetyltransferase [bacterium]
MKSLIRKIIPRNTRNSIKSILRKGKVYSYKASKTIINKKEMIGLLREAGVKKGDIIFFHSSLTALGYVEGGPDVIIEALKEAVGDEGTLVAPAYPFSGSALDFAKNTKALDLNTAKSNSGKISEIFRTNHADFRSLHPTHSCVAWGKYAEYLTQGHENSVTPLGTDSPFRKMLEFPNSKILILGSPFGRVTYFHIIEDMIDFPLKVYYPETFNINILYKNRSYDIRYKIHDPEISSRRVDNNKIIENYWNGYFEQNKLCSKVKVNKSFIYLIKCDDFTKALKDNLSIGKTIYSV